MPLSIEERSVGKTDLKPGMLIKFGYTKADNTAGTYSLLVVDPKRISERSRSPQLHGYNVDGVSDTDIIDFLTRLDYPIILDVKSNELRLPELPIQDAYDSLNSVATVDRPYRIFTLDKIGTINRIIIELPDEVSSILGQLKVVISNLQSKEQVIRLLDVADYEGLKLVPEIEKLIPKSTSFKKSEEE